MWKVMPGPNQITAFQNPTAEIEYLLEMPPSVLSDTRRKRLLVLQAFAEGHADQTIAARCKMSSEGVRKIRREVSAKGLPAVIAKLHSILAKKSAFVTTPRRRRGAPRAKSLRSAFSAAAARAETIITLASVILASDVQIAIIGVQSPNQTKRVGKDDAMPLVPGDGGTLPALRDAVREPIAPRWTRGQIDEWIRRPFLFLPSADPPANTARLLTWSLPSLASRFRKNWNFLVIGKGEPKTLDRTVSRIAKGRNTETFVLTSESLTTHLEAVLHTLRIRLNFRGLLPTLEGLLDASAEWRERLRATSAFTWHSNERQAIAGVKGRMVDFYVRATGGYLLDLTSHVHRSIATRATFKVTTIPTAPSIEVLKTEPDGDPVLNYSPFPGVEMAFQTVPPISAVEAMGLLAECKAAARFEYAVRLKPDQRAWLRVPYELLSPKQNSCGAPLEIGVVSLARQFIFPAPSETDAELQRHAEKLKRRGRVVAADQNNDGPMLVFSSEALLDGIYSAFALNRYGDRISQINGHEAWWSNLISGPVSASEFHRFSPVGFLFNPPYHFSDAELNGTSATEEMRQRLRNCVIPEYAACSGGLQQRNSGCLFPGYRREDAFKKLLTAFDADFLLREIAESDWKKLMLDSSRWTTAVHELVNAEYFPCGQPDTAKILQTIRLDFRPSGVRFRDLVPGWAIQARSAFESSGRILRHALENAQRLALSGLRPLAVASMSRTQILKSWKSFLGQTIRGRIEAEQPKRSQVSVAKFESFGEDLGADELRVQEDAVETVRILVEAVLKNGADEAASRKFGALAFEINREEWNEALKRIEESGKPRTYILGVLKALKLARDNPAKTPAGLARIGQQLNALRT